ncbi:hypothetical protein FHR96_000996 [Halomonas organivorans]|uniref:Uncharacterized protein n=1 Tax=Halomonas organivorans TaxID=257772 RepID=A0A7W5BW14_9GAMM|nr:hypothetical protein [Halomonas organivorans]MBB3140144.1 hypothetical protein [Halomonas organivorans]
MTRLRRELKEPGFARSWKNARFARSWKNARFAGLSWKLEENPAGLRPELEVISLKLAENP